MTALGYRKYRFIIIPKIRKPAVVKEQTSSALMFQRSRHLATFGSDTNRQSGNTQRRLRITIRKGWMLIDKNKRSRWPSNKG